MAERAPLRVAFINVSRRLWAGGHNYQRNLFSILSRHEPAAITPVLFVGMDEPLDEIADISSIPDVEVVRSPAFDRRVRGLSGALALGLDRAAAAEFRDHRIDLVFESARFFGWRLPIPTIAWFPDFQHRKLPHLFSMAARLHRDLGFRLQIASGRHILLSSASALSDLIRYYPTPRNGVSVVRFASEPPLAMLATSPLDVVRHYDLPPRYFYLPNQFWRHKNHRVVIDALDVLKQRGLHVVVVASGSTEDLREPHYFESTMSQVTARGLTANFRHLGLIPLEHVYALLRASTALINPSEFEGWSTTVEEAKSFGVPLILSDIDVHREQTAGSARYFGTREPEVLAGHMSEMLNGAGPVTARNLHFDLDRRVQSFACDFVRLAQEQVALAR
ncbi:glycosyltransferase involved in cell wall biosynthesis [Bradyrhizobium sp. USDA 4532]|uniref:glycosyltransferase family 4 protein n=1 Tax=unclassified Bradyrhizobium TaxID=2631580 RepID=UPI0020A2173E|nr:MULTISPECIES: glycosyltransferase family 1 protein [unclassified Bradyrhizobium]MCP1831676.1 glycosyltransferase involved in cell wall biosynthesis [Bradyrhizobium sp. USDA 4545]MCP1916513.1 glycosyltransferase involved in cell wall biosynthesis [Bradyrhizobium sp. USDA 4532]